MHRAFTFKSGFARSSVLVKSASTPMRIQEANSGLFCPSQEKFHTVILEGDRQYF